jgi:putative addiction module component (TIGR02574 family)
LANLLKLSPAERIQLAEDLWDSVAESPQSMPGLTAIQFAEIERRLIEHSRDPVAARTVARGSREAPESDYHMTLYHRKSPLQLSPHA